MKKYLFLVVLLLGVFKISFGQTVKVTNTYPKADGTGLCIDYEINYTTRVEYDERLGVNKYGYLTDISVKIEIKGVDGTYYEYDSPTNHFKFRGNGTSTIKGTKCVPCSNATATRCDINDVDIKFNHGGWVYELN